MAKFKIISKDGSTVRYEGKLRYNGTYLKPSYIEFPEISSPVPIEWEVGDYVDYGRTGMRYHLYSIPQASKVAKRDTDRIKGYEADGTPIYVNAYGGAFVYSNVQLHASTKDLEIAPFRDLVSNDNKRHFSTSPDVVTTENVEGIARRIQSCMDDLYPNKWVIRVESLTEEYSDAKDFALTGGTCLDALSKIYELWDDLGWIHTHENGKEVITIGYANKRTSSNTTDPYIYGKGNGLTAIKKNQTNKDEFATRLYIYGSERNLPAGYYHQMGISAVGGTDIRHLMLPMRVWGKTNGGSDPRKAYLENASAVAKYGVIPKTHYFDSVDAGADIYPSIEGMTAGSLRSAMSVSSDYYPSSRYSDSERMDEVISGDSIEDSGTVSEDGSSYTELKRFAIDNSYSTINIPAGSTVIESERHIILTHSFNENGKAKVVVNAEANGYILDAGFKSVTLMVEICDSLTDETVSEVMEIPLVKLENGDWVFNLPKEMSVKYDKADYNNFAVYYSVYASIELEEEATEDKTSELTVLSGNYVVTLTDILASTFNITLKQIGFNIDDRAANGNKKTISMKTGLCAGRNFAIERCTYNADVDTWTLTCRRQKDNTLGALFPNTSYHIYGGDRFVLTDIAMPNIYVSVAMERLLAVGEKLLARASKVQNNYEPSIDAKVMAKSGRILREGMYMEITDEDIVDGNTDYILIDSLNIYEDEDAIPTYKVTLRERKKVTYKGTPSASSTSDTSSVEDEEDKSLEGYATEKYVDEGDKALTERIDKLSVLLDWFFKYDDDTIGTNFNLFSLGQVSAGGIGTSGDGGGEGDGTGEGFLLINSWPVSGDYSSYALGANLGIELNERLKRIEDGEITPDLTGYATQDWVLERGYLTSADLTGYATQDWVLERGYLTSADLSGYALQSDVDALKEFFDGVEDQDALINKWHELEDFLAGVEEGDKLLAMVANNDTQINTLTEWVTALDKDVTAMKGLVDGFDTRITYFEDMFEWVLDDNGNRIAIRAKTNFFSELQIAAGGIGESIGLGSGGGITGIVVNGQTYNEPDEMGVLTLPDYPTSLLWSAIEDKPSFAAVATSGSYNDLTDKPAIPSLSGYATQQWVLSQGFAVASSLGGLAYKDGISWSDVSGRPTKLSDFMDDILSGKYLPIGGNAASATLASKAFQLCTNPSVLTYAYASETGSFMTLGRSNYAAYLDGSSVTLRYGSSLAQGLILNNSGNVTIGNKDLAGSDSITPKLYISGNTRLAGSLYFTDGAYISYTNIHLPSNDGSNAFNIYGSGNLTLASFFSNGKTYLGRQGNVLIGTSTDSGYKLDVYGSSRLAWDGSENSAIANPTNFILNTTTTGGWSRGFSIANNGTTMFTFGAFGDGGSLTYGYVGGTYGNPWVSFDSEKTQFNRNIKIGNAILSYDWNAGALKIENNLLTDTTDNGTRLQVAGNVFATGFIGNLDGTYINKLTGYTKATAISALAATDTLNIALGKLEYKADVAYNLVKGAYDGDGTIENLEEILRVLDGIKDTDTIQAIVGKYLPLIGGAIGRGGTNSFPLQVESTSGYTGIAFVTSGGTGWMRYSGGSNWGVTDAGWQNSYTLIHSGNIGDYKAGGIVAFDSRNKNYSPYANEFSRKALTVHFERALSVGYGTSDYNVCILNVSPWVSNSAGAEYQLAFRHDGAIGHRYGSTTWSNWKTIAFLDDNVASATKLADNTAFTAWGQTFFENGKPKNVSGNLHLGNGGDFEIGTGYSSSNTTRYNRIVIGANETGIQYYSGGWTSSSNVIAHDFKVGQNPTSALMVYNSGHVTISNNATIGGTVTIGGKSLFLYEDSTYAQRLTATIADNIARIYNTGTSTSLYLGEYNGNAISIVSNNVGIGTSDPQYKLDVYGSSRIAWNGSVNSVLATPTTLTIDTTITGGWDRTFRISHNGTTMFAFGAFGSGGSLTYGYIGGSYSSPWVSFDSEKVQFNKNIRIGNAILSYDWNAGALKIEGNVYATGQVASGGIGEEGDNIATYNKWGGLKPAYSTTGKATLTTTSQAFTNSPTIAARTTTAGRYYAVEMDAAGRAFVNVPWVNTNYWTLDSSYSRIYPADTARQLCVGGTGSTAYGTSTYKLVVHGSAFAISGTWQSSSDMTMKDVVKDIDLDIKDIANAPSFAFTWKGSEDKTEWLGTSAQYWKTILPTAVKGEEGSYSLSYGELALTTAIAIAKKTMNHEERIKELELQVKTLKDRLSVYEN